MKHRLFGMLLLLVSSSALAQDPTPAQPATDTEPQTPTEAADASPETPADLGDADEASSVPRSPITPLSLPLTEPFEDPATVTPPPNAAQAPEGLVPNDQLPGPAIEPPQPVESSGDETQAQEPAPEAPSTDTQDDRMTFVDPEFGLDLRPAEEIQQAQWQPIFDYGAEVRTRLGFDLANEYTMQAQPGENPPVAEGTEDVVDWRNSFSFWSRMKFTPSSGGSWSPEVQAFIEVYAEHSISGERAEGDTPTILFNGKDYTHQFMLQLREAYADVFIGPLDFRAGNQIVPWGTINVMSPSDRVNPASTDAFYWADISGTKQPIFAVRGQYHVSDMNLELLWMPFHTPQSVNVYGGDYSLFRYDNAYAFTAYPLPNIERYVDSSKFGELNEMFLSTKSPDASPVHTQAGFRFSGSKNGFDFGVSYLFTYEQMPSIWYSAETRALVDSALAKDNNTFYHYLESMQTALDRGATTKDFLHTVYERKHSVAGEFGATVGDVSLKAELAFLPDKLYYTRGVASTEHHTLSYAAAVDYMKTDLGVVDQLVFSLELFGSWLDGVHDGENLLYSNEANLGLFGTFRIAFLDEDLQLEVTEQTNFSSKEYVVVPKISYEVVENLRLLLGAVILGSWVSEPEGFNLYSSNTDDKSSLFGSYSNNDQLFLMGKYNF